MNTKVKAVPAQDEVLAHHGRCLVQALAWAHKCFEHGCTEMQDEFSEELQTIRAMLAGGAHIEVRLDLTHETADFTLCVDACGENAVEHHLFTQGLAPKDKAN